MSYENKLCCLTCINPGVACDDLSGWALVEYILFCHTLWWIFYYFLLLVTKQSEEWCCRFLTLFHGCLISYSALKDAYINKSPIDFQNTPLSNTKKNYLSYMLSYFLFDFFWIHFFGNETWVIYCHHLVSIVIIVNILVKNYGGAGVAYGAAGLELTNPCLQLRWFLRSHGYYNKPIHKITELCFVISFIIIRLIGGTILAYYSIVLSNTDFLTKLSFLSIYGISLVILWQIVVFFKKKYFPANQQSHIYLIQSRLSISPYFQRRTLDRHENLDTEENDLNDAGKTSLTSSQKKVLFPEVGPVSVGSFVMATPTAEPSKEMSFSSEINEVFQEKKESIGDKSNVTIETVRRENIGDKSNVSIESEKKESIGDISNVTVMSKKKENIGGKSNVTVVSVRRDSIADKSNIAVESERNEEYLSKVKQIVQ